MRNENNSNIGSRKTIKRMVILDNKYGIKAWKNIRDYNIDLHIYSTDKEQNQQK